MASIHGTVLDVMGAGVFLRGPPGSGKSDLALRLIESSGHNEIRLVADDRVILDRQLDALIASAPPSLFGVLEVRGLGLIKVEAGKSVPLRLIVDLVERPEIDRMPDFAQNRTVLGEIELPLLKMNAFEASAPAKIKIALRLLCHSNEELVLNTFDDGGERRG